MYKALVFITLILGIGWMSCTSKKSIYTNANNPGNQPDTIFLETKVDTLLFFENDPFQKNDNLIGFYTFKNADDIISLLSKSWGTVEYVDSNLNCEYIFCNSFRKSRWENVQIGAIITDVNIYMEKTEDHNIPVNFVAAEFLLNEKNINIPGELNSVLVKNEFNSMLKEIHQLKDDTSLLNSEIDVADWFHDTSAFRIIFDLERRFVYNDDRLNSFYFTLDTNRVFTYFQYNHRFETPWIAEKLLRNLPFPVIMANGMKRKYHFGSPIIREAQDAILRKKIGTEDMLMLLKMAKLHLNHSKPNYYSSSDTFAVSIFSISDSVSAFSLEHDKHYRYAGYWNTKKDKIYVLSERAEDMDYADGAVKVVDANFDGKKDILYNYFTDFRGNAYYSLYLNKADTFVRQEGFGDINLPIIDSKKQSIYSVYSAAATDGDYKGVYKWKGEKLEMTDWVVLEIAKFDAEEGSIVHDLYHYKFNNGYKYLYKKQPNYDWSKFQTYIFDRELSDDF